MTQQSPSQVALARLSFMASVIDTFITVAVILLVNDLLEISPLSWSSPFLLGGLLFVVPVLHLFLTEIVLGGQSVGKFCVGLRIQRRMGGGLLSYNQRVARFAIKVPFFGLMSLNANRLPFYNDTKDIYLRSDLVKNEPSLRSSPLKRWELKVIDGVHRGLTFKLTEAASFRKNGEVRIGRSPAWADLVLADERQISGQHCLLKVENNLLYLRDFGANGAGSSNGTFLEGRKLAPGQWVAVGTSSQFQVANVKIMIVR